MNKNKSKSFKSLISKCALSASLLFCAGQVFADNCFIMVHGHGVQGNVQSPTNQPALDNWRSAEFSAYQGSEFFTSLLEPGDNYGIVGYDSTEQGGYPYWRDETAGEIARQIISIKGGNGDGYVHSHAGTQCAANDMFTVIAHSQGGAEMMYISGNSVAGSPYYNTAYTTSGSSPSVSTPKTVDFASAMNGILAIVTLGSPLSGTEGADRICDGSIVDGIIASLMGRNCYGDVEWLQTHNTYAVKNFVGTNLGAPVYVLGGYKAFPGAASASSGFLTGEDDGFINLASQMSCVGSGKRNLQNDLSEYNTFLGIPYGSPIFTCDNANKGTPRTFNAASIHTDHDAERNGGLITPSNTAIPDGVDCGSRQNMAGRINDCL